MTPKGSPAGRSDARHDPQAGGAVAGRRAAPPGGHRGRRGRAGDRTLRLAAIALAAEQVGGAQRCLDMSVEYAKIRMQFGPPIGSFQAIKHMCADMLLEVESARSAAYYAAWAAEDESDELPLVTGTPKAYCSEAYFRAAADNIQIHGGIGFTWEHDAHLYYRRAKSTELMLGTPGEHREIAAGYLSRRGRPAYSRSRARPRDLIAVSQRVVNLVPPAASRRTRPRAVASVDRPSVIL